MAKGLRHIQCATRNTFSLGDRFCKAEDATGYRDTRSGREMAERRVEVRPTPDGFWAQGLSNHRPACGNPQRDRRANRSGQPDRAGKEGRTDGHSNPARVQAGTKALCECGILLRCSDAFSRLPADLFTATFAASRSIGWTANILEQVANNRLIRPEIQYTGPLNRKVVPLNAR